MTIPRATPAAASAFAAATAFASAAMLFSPRAAAQPISPCDFDGFVAQVDDGDTSPSDLRSAFEALDVDGDGWLTQGELLRLSPPGTAHEDAP